MTPPTHFHDFKPCEAVQYDGIANGDAPLWAHSTGFSGGVWTPGGSLYLANGTVVRPGQWLIRQGSRVWVQDEEPARVERWDTGRRSPGGDVWFRDWFVSWPEVRRPVLSNGWTGPWTPVEGGGQ